MKTFLFIDGDMAYNRNKGKPVFISGNAKTAQDVAYFLMTDDDPIRGVGAKIKNIDTYFKDNGLFGGALQGFIGNEVRVAIDRLIESQQIDLSQIDDAERVTGINQLILAQDSATSIVFNLSVQVGTEDIIPLGYRVRLGHQFTGSERPGIPGVITDDARSI